MYDGKWAVWSKAGFPAYLWLVWVASAWALYRCAFCRPKYVAGCSIGRCGPLWLSWCFGFSKYPTTLPTCSKSLVSDRSIQSGQKIYSISHISESEIILLNSCSVLVSLMNFLSLYHLLFLYWLSYFTWY